MSSALDVAVDKLNRQQRELLNNLEGWKSEEREHQEQLNEDAKDLDKMTNKQSLLVKKVQRGEGDGGGGGGRPLGWGVDPQGGGRPRGGGQAMGWML